MSDEPRKTDTDRRRFLLAGTALATIGALATPPAAQQAQAQTPAPAAGRKPNILVEHDR